MLFVKRLDSIDERDGRGKIENRHMPECTKKDKSVSLGKATGFVNGVEQLGLKRGILEI